MEPIPPHIESLLANERLIEPVPNALHRRAVERARTVVVQGLRHDSRNDSRSSRWMSRPRRMTVAVAAAASVMLVALCALAFRTFYRSSLENQGPPPRAWTPVPSIPDLPVPTATPKEQSAVVPTVATPTERWSKRKIAGRLKITSDNEGYSTEFSLLQPAYQAVARRDFTSALMAIAEHQHRFASGQLAEEREALRVKSLLGLGRRAEAQRAALAFGDRFPRSVLLKRIESMLEAAP